MHELTECLVHCPYCGEGISVLVDTSAGDQQYTEDCQVCCSPILMTLQVDNEGLVFIEASQEND